MDTLVEVEGVARLGPPKTRAGRRTVALPRSVTRIASAHVHAYCNAPGGDPWLFPSASGKLERIYNRGL